MRWWSGVPVLLLACACAGEAMADVQLSGGMTQATVGGTLTISASLVDSGPYTLSLTDQHPARGAICATRLAGPTRAVRGRIKLTGRVPTSWACYSSDRSVLTRAKIAAGTYTLWLCQAAGPTGCNADRTTIHNQVLLKLPGKRSR